MFRDLKNILFIRHMYDEIVLKIEVDNEWKRRFVRRRRRRGRRYEE